MNTLFLSAKNGKVEIKDGLVETRTDSFSLFIGNNVLKYNKKDNLFIINNKQKNIKNPDLSLDIYNPNGEKVFGDKIFSDDNRLGIDIGQGKIYLTELNEKEKNIFNNLPRTEQLRSLGLSREELSRFLNDYESKILSPSSDTSKIPEDTSKYKYPSGTIIYQDTPFTGRSHTALIINENGKTWVYQSFPPEVTKISLDSFLNRYFFLGKPVFYSPDKTYSEYQIANMVKYADSELGRSYSLQNKEGGINCCTFIGSVLEKTGEYKFSDKVLYSKDLAGDNLKNFRIKN